MGGWRSAWTETCFFFSFFAPSPKYTNLSFSLVYTCIIITAECGSMNENGQSSRHNDQTMKIQRSGFDIFQRIRLETRPGWLSEAVTRIYHIHFNEILNKASKFWWISFLANLEWTRLSNSMISHKTVVRGTHLPIHNKYLKELLMLWR